MQLTTRINQDHIAFFQRLWIFDAMRERAVRPEEHNLEIATRRCADLSVGRVKKGPDLCRGDTCIEHRGGGFMHGERHFFGAFHQSKFCWGFNHAAGCGHRRAICQRIIWRGFGDTVTDEKGRGFIYAKRLNLSDILRENSVRIFMFFPCRDFALNQHELLNRAFFKFGSKKERSARLK